MRARTPRKPDRPVLWIVAGPNGSGKSSLYNRTDIEGWGGSVWIINPDLLTAKIVEEEGAAALDANLSAVKRVETWLYASVDAYQTVGVETVLSSPKYRALVERAHERGFEVRMIYVVLASADLQLARIRQRVRDGGHDVPKEKVVDRRRRSLEELCWFASKVEQLFVFDNSAGQPNLIAWKDGTRLHFSGAMPVDLFDALAAHDLLWLDDHADLE